MSKPLSSFADIYYGKSPTGVSTTEGEIPIYGTGGVYGIASASMFRGPAIIIPRKGSLSNPHLVEEPFWPSDTTYAAIPKPDVDARWLYYQLCLFNLESLNEATGVPSISRDWLVKSRLYPHDPDSQVRIAQILTTIDGQIESTEALITKQERVRQGLMQDLFTRGIDTSGELRPPREKAPHLYHQTELGWIPNGWEVRPVARCTESVMDGPFGSNLKSEHYVNEPGVRVVRLQNVQAGYYEDGDPAYVSDSHGKFLIKFSVLPDDVLIASLGDDKYLAGRACCYPHGLGAAVNKADCFRVRPDPRKSIAQFLMLTFNSERARTESIRLIQGVTRQRINTANFKKMKISIPGLDEQKLIADAFITASVPITGLGRELHEVQRLKSGLMQDLLTGRVSVAPLLAKDAA